jgi:hypothetical protein
MNFYINIEKKIYSSKLKTHKKMKLKIQITIILIIILINGNLAHSKPKKVL